MKKKDITISGLAIMIHNGFEKTATKDQLLDLENKFEKRFDGVDKRLDRIEKLILADHRERIEKLEMEVKDLKDLLAFK